MDLSDLESSLPIHGESSEKVGSFGVTWLDLPPSSGGNMIHDSNHESHSDLPTAVRLHSCEYCEWGYGNEASDVDFYIYAALHIQIPRSGKVPRTKARRSTLATKKKPSIAVTSEPVKKQRAPALKKTSPAKARQKKNQG